MHGLTLAGSQLLDALDRDGKQPLTTPMVRATHPRAWYRVLCQRFGSEQALAILRIAGCASVTKGAGDQWVPLRSQMKLLHEVEARFGDGSCDLIRQLATDAVRFYPSLRKIVMRALPLTVMLDFSPGAYLREFNHGRVEVDHSHGPAEFRNFDWLSSKERCAAWHGSYEGGFAWIGIQATVEKKECILRGDEFCGYLVSWQV